MSKIKQSLCSKRRTLLLGNMTYFERLFKTRLDDLNIKYIPQKGFIAGDNFCIVDFYLPKPYKTCIEIDGEYHNTAKQQIRDTNRTEYLLKRGFKVLRIKNEDVKTVDIMKALCTLK